MSKKWIDFKIQDVRKCIERLPEDQRDDFRLKPINKRQKDVLMFTPKDFKKYRENEICWAQILLAEEMPLCYNVAQEILP